MTAPLRRVAVCTPKTAGWLVRKRVAQWSALGYRHKPEFAAAQKQHDALCKALADFGAEVLPLPEDDGYTLDAIYPHDASLVTDHGAILLRMGKTAREGEPPAHQAFYESLGIPVFGRIRAPGMVEAGDIVWLDEKTLLAGRGYRTNAAGIEQLRALLGPKGVEVSAAPLPHYSGPKSCMHLMSILSLIGEGSALTDTHLLAVETVELLESRGIRFVEMDPAERDSLACNVLALGNGKLLALEGNPKTKQKLWEAGFEVKTIPGGELALNGGGGPTCLTRPILRA